MKDLFVKKSLQQVFEEQGAARKRKHVLGLGALIAMGLGAIIGAGIFVLTGPAAAMYAGPGMILSFIFAAIICVFAAFCYAELAAMIPISGSAYTYTYVTMGEIVAWIVGWGLTVDFLCFAATVSAGWSAYFVSFLKDFGLSLPAALTAAPMAYDLNEGWSLTGNYFNLPAACIAVVMGILVARGMRVASLFNNIMVFVKLAAIVLFVGCGIAFVRWDNLTPLIPENTGVFGQFGISGILRGAGVVFFAFLGFDTLATMASECKDPQKHLPRAMLGSLGISALIYVVMTIVMLGVVSYVFLNRPDFMTVVIGSLGSNFAWLNSLIKLAILAGLTSVVLVMILGQSRIFYTMSKDGLLPSRLKKINEKTEAPVFTTLLVTLLCATLGGIFPVTMLGQMTNMGALLGFTLVCFSVLVLRYRQPGAHRPFKVPFFPWLPIAGMGVCLFQMLVMPGVTWLQFLVWMLLGGIVYFGYGARHSLARQKKS